MMNFDVCGVWGPFLMMLQESGCVRPVFVSEKIALTKNAGYSVSTDEGLSLCDPTC